MTTLPDRLPQVPGVELAATHLPAGDWTEARGDWYDVVAMPGGAVGIAIGDVVGRGVEAAAQVSKLRDGLRTFAQQGLGPAQALHRVNALVSDTRREMSTLLFVVYDPHTGELRGANAGHPPAFVRRSGGSVERWAAERSLPLGVIPDADYGEAALALELGDAVLLFTDGLIERRDVPVGEALDRVEALVAHATTADELRTRVLDGMLGSGDPGDDVAVFTLLRTRITSGK